MAAARAAGAAPGPHSGASSSDAVRDRSIKGPALASTAHTFQLVVMLALNSVLIGLIVILLPAHLLWRKALAQHHQLAQSTSGIAEAAGNATASTFGSALPDGMSAHAYDAVLQSTARADSFARNMIASLGLLFGAPRSDTVATTWVARAIRSTLAAVLLSQGWFVARFKGWFDEAEAMERGDRDEVLHRRRSGIAKKMEEVALTSFALPIPMFIIYALIILCGAPVFSHPLDTLVLSGYIAVLAALPVITLLETDESEYIKAFSDAGAVAKARRSMARLKVLRPMTLSTLAGALIGSAGLLLDWDKAWQVYPVPSVLGAAIGAIVGNALGGLSYLSAVPLRRSRESGPHVEHKKPSSSKKKKR